MGKKGGRTTIRRKLDIAITLGLVVVWLALLLYPNFSDFWNGFGQQDAIQTYDEALERMGQEDMRAMLERARQYNAQLLQAHQGKDPGAMEHYEDLLDIDGRSTMCIINIPSLHVRLPVKHGTDEGLLQNFIGHMQTTSLPVGGTGTHSVMVGHRGLPSSILFTDLDQLKEGDLFYLQVLGEELYYEVDQILTVLPHEMDALEIDPEQDLCTLVTCTPYGVNSHRLLVRGHRTEAPVDPETGEVVDLTQRRIHPVFYTVALAIAMIGLLELWKKWRRARRRKKGRSEA